MSSIPLKKKKNFLEKKIISCANSLNTSLRT